MPKVLAHILLYNSSLRSARACIRSLLDQQFASSTNTLDILVTDNASTNDTWENLRNEFGASVRFERNKKNLGFCGGHNSAAFECISKGYDFLLVLNPDVRLELNALRKAVAAVEGSLDIGTVAMRLIRCNEDLEPLHPRIIDSAGMYVTSALRHFDTGAGAADGMRWDGKREVFGATGASLLLRKEFIESVSFWGEKHEKDVEALYPFLSEGREKRVQLFDEAFFAYREDAELAWRGQILGWRCLYVGDAVGYHKRVVTPEERSNLPELLNRLGVRNRFLLQLNDYVPVLNRTFLEGIFIRNLLVVLGVILKERSSIKGIEEVRVLYKRALERREKVLGMRRKSVVEIEKFFSEGERYGFAKS